MNITLKQLNFSFSRKPLLVGGKAMEYYGLRKSGPDTDLVGDEKDVVVLIKQYPDRVKDLWGDLGVCPLDFEIWRSINLLTYDDLKEEAVDIGDVLVISKEKLLLMKAFAMKDDEKYRQDTELIVADMVKRQYERLSQVYAHNEKLLQGIEAITYLEKKGKPST